MYIRHLKLCKTSKFWTDWIFNHHLNYCTSKTLKYFCLWPIARDKYVCFTSKFMNSLTSGEYGTPCAFLRSFWCLWYGGFVATHHSFWAKEYAKKLNTQCLTCHGYCKLWHSFGFRGKKVSKYMTSLAILYTSYALPLATAMPGHMDLIVGSRPWAQMLYDDEASCSFWSKMQEGAALHCRIAACW